MATKFSGDVTFITDKQLFINEFAVKLKHGHNRHHYIQYHRAAPVGRLWLYGIQTHW